MSKLKYLLIAAVVVGAIAAAVIWQQRVLVATLPTRVVCESKEDAHTKAGPTAFPVLGTGSMAPFIPPSPAGSDPLFTVVAYAKPASGSFDVIKKGDLVVYRPKWVKGLVIHQAVDKTQYGWIMSGLNNRQSESWEPITEKEFVCIIGEVYVW